MHQGSNLCVKSHFNYVIQYIYLKCIEVIMHHASN